MTPRTFVALAGATALGLIAAAGTVIQESRLAGQTVVLDEAFFPELVKRANDVARLTYRTPNEEAVVELKDGDWVFTSRAGYPVQSGNVRSVVASVAALRRLEPKTSDPEKYARLAVEGLDVEGGLSREIVMETADGDVLAAVIVGRVSAIMQFDPLGGTYVREIGDPVSWLARGTIALPPTALDLMNRMVFHVPGPDIREIQVWEGGESVLLVDKREDEAGVLRYILTEEGDGIRASDAAVKQLASGIVSFTFDDVAPVADVEFPADGRRIAFRTFDGMELLLTLAKIDETEAWLKAEISLVEGATGTERAERFRNATEGWAFRLPSHKRSILLRDAAGLTEPIPDPNAVNQPPLPPGFGLPGGALGRPALPGLGR
ncbi:MAG: DUF4340 domain-containing protein [Proteobacteria bacterium]|nr:DUF4340 domain-containing protein [Pseudomonadota bacterium]